MNHPNQVELRAIADGLQLQRLYHYKEGAKGKWVDVPANEALHLMSINEAHKLRVKPATVRIGNYEVPKPVDYNLDYEQVYYPVTLTGVIESDDWEDTQLDIFRRDAGLIHLTKEDAELHRKALLSFTQRV